MYYQSMHYILHSIYDHRSPITNKFLYFFLLQSLHDYLCCRARDAHAPPWLQPTLPPLQSSIYSSSNSMSIYHFDCFSARLSAPVRFFVSTPHIWPKIDMPIQYNQTCHWFHRKRYNFLWQWSPCQLCQRWWPHGQRSSPYRDPTMVHSRHYSKRTIRINSYAWKGDSSR